MASDPAAPSKARPCIMLLSIASEEWFDEMYARLITALSARAPVVRARTSNAALTFLHNNHPSAIFATDPGVVEPENGAVLQALKQYVSSGGKLIFGGLFSSFVPPMEMGAFFRNNFDLPWESGAYHRTTLQLNFAAIENLPARRQQLAFEYSQKALHVKNVDLAGAIYLPTRDSRIESCVFPPTPISSSNETPAAWARVGQGWVGYIGDVNAEEDTDGVVLAMCGV
ncbi:hypothetical protein PRK78_004068 [Emydomyces testavorans]|uniref:Uncharacterized protein n=1 Tax=Emydomyces testavorans TaxID=2070801 RepID=A0AAF0II96_9EURO|nr:hypothetical protein PRK78_004068 [Emydomyces testavorans]